VSFIKDIEHFHDFILKHFVCPQKYFFFSKSSMPCELMNITKVLIKSSGFKHFPL
jgi:hypothetical protein